MPRSALTLRLAVALLCAGAPLSAQIELGADDLRTPVGTTFTMESLVIDGPVAASGVVLGPAGADQTFDFTTAIDAAVRLTMEARVVDAADAPDADTYPEADIAVLYRIDDGNGTSEMTAYIAREAEGDRIVAIVGAGDLPTIAQQRSSMPVPLSYGATWSDPDAPIDSEIGDGVTMVGSVSQEGEVDGWGTVRVPAGPFPCLRIHQTGQGTVHYEGNADLEAVGAVGTASESWSWNTRHVGAVAMVAQIDMTLQGNTSTSTQVTRLLSLQGLPSAVVAYGWGQLKALHLPARPTATAR